MICIACLLLSKNLLNCALQFFIRLTKLVLYHILIKNYYSDVHIEKFEKLHIKKKFKLTIWMVF